MAKKPDILVSIPTDATATADAYKQAAAAGIKIIFMDQRANGLEAGKDYVSVVSADNYGNGYASGTVPVSYTHLLFSDQRIYLE